MTEYQLPMKDGKVDILAVGKAIKRCSLAPCGMYYVELSDVLNALVSHAKAEERERCVKAIEGEDGDTEQQWCAETIRGLEDEI